ncbi:MAG: T9SS type A sorting domain-containing protein [Saprospiraceae bacterium]|nr:T9SS type A sorting domain-containing protein [Saprospiraceae bacterium]
MLRLRFLLLLSVVTGMPALLRAQNDKQVLGEPVITPAELLEGTSILYLIRFQNTGQDTAQDIVIRDTLDPKLDPETFVTLSTSHDFQLLGEGGSFIRWYFQDILLPDSASGAGNSIGYVLFSVSPRPFLAPGQTILNHACISFDQSAVICTNDAVVLIDDEADTEEPDMASGDLQIVPNPNYGQFEVRTLDEQESASGNRDARWWITDMNGKTVWNGITDDLAAVNNRVMLERPSPGLYLLWVRTKESIQVERFSVIH